MAAALPTQNETVASFPPIQPYKTGFLDVSVLPKHSLYFEESGNPNGKPVVCVHGGPGGGSSPNTRTFFDPNVYRIIQFDQRGAGQSVPFASLEENTTWHLVADMEKLREHLAVESWVVFGGSWGSTLSLAYAETFPTRVKALILRGIFTLRRSELLFFYQEGSSWIFPDGFETYANHIPACERGDLMSAYYRKLTHPDESVRLAAANKWTQWEMLTSRLIINPALLDKAEDPKFAVAFARIEAHYFVHGGFFECDDYLIKNAHKLKDIPTVIVQGRYDVVCPAKTAWDLSKQMPHAKLHIIPDAGHSMAEVGIANKLIEAGKEFATL